MFKMAVHSHKGMYHVEASETVEAILTAMSQHDSHCIVDKKILTLYPRFAKTLLRSVPCIPIVATEPAKSLERCSHYVKQLHQAGIQRHHTLIALGGGVIQDITAFLSHVMLRGVPWVFIPTTLLAQADSCIGSKSSINCAHIKNVIGTFNPPQKIYLCSQFLTTLSTREWQSGMGEIIKIHALHNLQTLSNLVRDYDTLKVDTEKMQRYIHASLRYKKSFIEADEMDKGIRQILNYGHTFGHAIEAATHFKISHGIAITIGMDLANFIAWKQFHYPQHFETMHALLQKNYHNVVQKHVIDMSIFFEALMRDKKNYKKTVGCILPTASGVMKKVWCEPTSSFRKTCKTFFITEGLL